MDVGDGNNLYCNEIEGKKRGLLRILEEKDQKACLDERQPPMRNGLASYNDTGLMTFPSAYSVVLKFNGPLQVLNLFPYICITTINRNAAPTMPACVPSVFSGPIFLVQSTCTYVSTKPPTERKKAINAVTSPEASGYAVRLYALIPTVVMTRPNT